MQFNHSTSGQTPNKNFHIPKNPSRIELAPIIKETRTHFLVLLKTPHLKKEELQIEVRREKTIVISELLCGYFKRFTLPNRVESHKTKASYSGDILQILLPKKEIELGKSFLQ